MQYRIVQRKYKLFPVENWYKYKKEKLEPGEVERLRALNMGYGNFITNARRLGIHPNTYRYIIDRGHGTTRYINIIRAVLLKGYENHTPQPAEDTPPTGGQSAGGCLQA